MSTIVILPDYEVGHVFPSFRIARNLQSAGYSVWYVGIPDVMVLVERHEFNHKIIFEDIYPLGYLRDIEENRLSGNTYSEEHFSHLLANAFDCIIEALRPDLIVSSLFLSLESLIIHHKYKIPQIIYNFTIPKLTAPENAVTSAAGMIAMKRIMKLSGTLPERLLAFLNRDNIPLTSLSDLVAPLDNFPQFILCPEELFLGNYVLNTKDIPIGPCIRESTVSVAELQAEYLARVRNKKVIFCSMGSQTIEYIHRVEKIFRILIECAKSIPDYHFILSIGKSLEPADLGDVPENVSVFDWVPQVEILPFTSLAIIHGGLGSIKECVFFGVPMVVVPMGRDQIDNGERVRRNNLGTTGDIDNISAAELIRAIKQVVPDTGVNSAIGHMRKHLQEEEAAMNDVNFIKQYIGLPVSSGVRG